MIDQSFLKDIREKIPFSIHDSRFTEALFAFIEEINVPLSLEKTDPLLYGILRQEIELSQEVDQSQLQEGCSVRNVLKARVLARLLTDDEKGWIKNDQLLRAIQILQQNLYCLGPGRHHDSRRQEQTLIVLERLRSYPDFSHALRALSKPLGHQWANQIIRDTLGMPHEKAVGDVETRRAALAAWLTFPRQSVGSCFGTAPAIMIHNEQPWRFLKDINDLLSTGRMKRVVGGIQYSAPLSASWGKGDLNRALDCAELLKSEHGVWDSPAFIAALSEVGELKLQGNRQEKKSLIKTIVYEFINSRGLVNGYISVEDLMKGIILQAKGLSEDDVSELKSRPKQMIQSGLMMHVPKAAKNSGGKGGKMASFEEAFDRASTIFRSFADNALLKAWEFTMASFAETKIQFARWNLYASLGLSTDLPYGIGSKIISVLKEKLDFENGQTHRYQEEYDQMFDHVRFLELRMSRATNKEEATYIQIEYSRRSAELRDIIRKRDEAHDKAKRFANMPPAIVDFYDNKFQDFFQEVYDPDLHDVKTGPYDDSPAGFRLLYKHGRSNTSQWTLIYDLDGFINALNAFFVSTESELVTLPICQGVEQDIGEIVTAIVIHIKTKEFLEAAFYRMAQSHGSIPIKDPLENLDKIEKKPWVYTSGGTMNNLTANYYSIEQVTEMQRWVEDPEELLVFLVDSVKFVHPNIRDRFLKEKDRSMLMNSPTHAFLFKPGLYPFNLAWQADEYTYTWIRDHWIVPHKNFMEKIAIEDRMMRAYLDVFETRLHEDFRPYFRQVFATVPSSMNMEFFREHLLRVFAEDPGFMRHGRGIVPGEMVDSLIYELFPMIHRRSLKDHVEAILKKLPQISPEELGDVEEILELFESAAGEQSIITSSTLQDICKNVILILKKQSTFAHDYHWLVRKAAAELGFAMPLPILFADSNWTKEYFGFMINPGTRKMEFWRFDSTALKGVPMNYWKHWLDGSRKNPTWGIYTRPQEYIG